MERPTNEQATPGPPCARAYAGRVWPLRGPRHLGRSQRRLDEDVAEPREKPRTAVSVVAATNAASSKIVPCADEQHVSRLLSSRRRSLPSGSTFGDNWPRRAAAASWLPLLSSRCSSPPLCWRGAGAARVASSCTTEQPCGRWAACALDLRSFCHLEGAYFIRGRLSPLAYDTSDDRRPVQGCLEVFAACLLVSYSALARICAYCKGR